MKTLKEGSKKGSSDAADADDVPLTCTTQADGADGGGSEMKHSANGISPEGEYDIVTPAECDGVAEVSSRKTRSSAAVRKSEPEKQVDLQPDIHQASRKSIYSTKAPTGKYKAPKQRSDSMSSDGKARRLSPSVDKVDLEYTLGSLESPQPKRQRLDHAPASTGSGGSKKKMALTMQTAAEALKPKFWNDGADPSKDNVAASSFDVADDDVGGSSPMDSTEDAERSGLGTDCGSTKQRLNSEVRMSIEQAENVMRDTSLAAERLDEEDEDAKATPTDKENDIDPAKKRSATNDDDIDDSEADRLDFDNHAVMHDTDDDDAVILKSDISSASSLVDSFLGDEESRPFPPAPPSTPATSKGVYQPLPYQSDCATGELEYSVVLKQGGDPADAPMPPHSALTPRPSARPTPSDLYGAETPRPETKRGLTAEEAEAEAETPRCVGETPRDLSEAITEPRRGGAAAEATPQPKDKKEEFKLTRKADFEQWDVGDRYQLKKMLGRGSYGEVAQATDLLAVALREKAEKVNPKPQSQEKPTPQHRNATFVAVKKISKAFDQEVDAVRLFREMHILRRLSGHECIIQLVDVVQPSSADEKLFSDLYLVFEFVDTDLYKLIMSPQYLTTEHIQTFLYQMLVGLKYIHSSSGKLMCSCV